MATQPVPVDGVHHVTFAVVDLDESSRWWERVFGATRRPELDHASPEGAVYAHVVLVPGLGAPVQLRLDPAAARATAGADVVSLAVPTERDLHDWARRFDDLGVEHSPVLRGFSGWLMVARGPDGASIRLYSRESHEWDPKLVEYDRAWVPAPPPS